MSQPKIKILRVVVVPVLQWAVDQQILVTITEPIRTGALREDASDKGKAKKPARIMRVQDHMDGGRVKDVIVGTALDGILGESYPDNSYVGRSFSLLKQEAPGKDYNRFLVNEVEVS